MIPLNIEGGTRHRELFEAHLNEYAAQTDRLFAWLFGFQWLLGVCLAIGNAPFGWEGDESYLHFHLLMSIFFGGIVASLPMFLTIKMPGQPLNRYVVAVAQMAFSGMYIHLTGGRIETHFHIFGSMAFLAFYHDFRPIILATLITSFDHFVRGYFYPESIYGVTDAAFWRAIEHSAWIAFEDVVLFLAIVASKRTVWSMAYRKAQVEENLQDAEQTIISSAKMSALGQMAGGMAHEINTPLSIITMEVEGLEERLTGLASSSETRRSLANIRETALRIAGIVNSLRLFARDGSFLPPYPTGVDLLITETLAFCSERFRVNGVELTVVNPEAFANLVIECRRIEISQVLLNLLNNAFDAAEAMPQEKRWVRVEVRDLGRDVEFSVSDGGPGVPTYLRNKIMEPFFTTKEVGKGTGLGLSLSKGILHSHNGKLFLDESSKCTRFAFVLPKVQPVARSKAA